MKKQLLCFSLAVCAAILLLSTAFAAEGAPEMQITGQRFMEKTCTFQVNLKAEEIRGVVFVAVYAQNAQIKSIEEYPAAPEVAAQVRNVLDTDTIKAMWLDEAYMPLAQSDVPRLSEFDAKNYDDFANAVLGVLQSYDAEVTGQSALEDLYAFSRLIVRSDDALPNLDGFGVVQRISDTEGHTILQFSNRNEAEACAKYLGDLVSADGYVTPDTLEMIVEEPGDNADASHLSWGVPVIHANSYAADLFKRGINRQITVAVVDSGVDYTHPFLKGRTVSGYDFVDNDSNPMDEHYHGTHVAGTIVDCTMELTNLKIMPVRVLGASGGGTTLNVGLGIRYAADHGAKVINLSLGGVHNSYKDESIDYAISKNVVVVVSAGNGGTNADSHCPAHIKNCITVAAVDKNLKPADFSNYGNAVDLAAPGVDVKSCTPGNKYEELNGTSMASPHVAACAAMLMEESTSLTPAQVKKKLVETVQVPSGWDKKYGAGIVNMGSDAVFYAILYTDGELVFQNSSTPASGRTTAHEPYQINAAVEPAYALWYSLRDKITTVTFAEEVHPLSTALWFYDCKNLKTIGNLKNLKTESVTNMSQMFSRCSSLTTLDLTGFDTRNVTDMRQMFFQCSSLNLVLASDTFSVSKVTESTDMFAECKLRNRYPNGPTDKTYARIDNPTSRPGYFGGEQEKFFYAILYTDGELVFQNSATTASGRTTAHAPYQINAAVEPAYAGWYPLRDKIATVAFAEEVHPTSTALWFYDCKNLKTIRNLDKLKTESVTNMSQMFSRCTGLETLDLRGFDTRNVTDMRQMFFQCSSLTTILVSDLFSVAKVTESTDMFGDCSKVVGEQGTKYNSNYTGKTYARIDKGSSNPGYFKSNPLPPLSNKLYAVLYSDGELKFQSSPNTESGRTAVKSYTTDSGGYAGDFYAAWYAEREKIKSVNFGTAIAPSSTALWFYDCKNLSTIKNPGNLYTNYVTDMSQMFAYCSSLTSLDLSGFNTGKTENTSMMFYGCGKLKTIYASGSFATGQISDSDFMFSDCAALKGGNGTSYSSGHVDKAYARIDSASAPGYFTAK